jgi:hypothetical protein
MENITGARLIKVQETVIIAFCAPILRSKGGDARWYY